jgi:predicted ATPase
MIKFWSVSNFKSIRDEAKIDFAPLTFFVGQNSAGKSTLIQSILLTAQTIQSNVADRSVVLNGRIIRLGSFSDIRANKSKKDEVKIGFQLGQPLYGGDNIKVATRSKSYYTPEIQKRMKAVCSSFSFSAGKLDDVSRELQLQPRLESGSVSFKAIDEEGDSEFGFIRRDESPVALLRRLSVDVENVRISDFSALDFKVVDSNDTSVFRGPFRLIAKAEPAGVLLRHFLPTGVGVSYDSISEEVNFVFELLIDAGLSYRYRDMRPSRLSELLVNMEIRKIFIDACRVASEVLVGTVRERFMRELNELENDFGLDRITRIQSLLSGQGRKTLALQVGERERKIKELLRAGRPAKNEISAAPVSESVMFSVDYVTSFFSERLKYLGPLRDEPKAIYPLAGYNDPKDIGFKGEFTAAVMDNNKNSPVTYVPSSSFPFSSGTQIIPINTNLVGAVQDWLEYLGIAKAVATEDMGKLGHELTIATAEPGQLHDLTHVGVGVSQALPIVVLSLLAEAGSTLIFEQPELHLNPRVQTRLADFFMSLIFSGKQCVVETHSEYLISRLRYLSALAKDVPISKLIKIYFVEKPGDQSVYNEVEMTDGGVIKNWPVGFFDETERNSQAIIQAQIEKSLSRRKKTDSGEAK